MVTLIAALATGQTTFSVEPAGALLGQEALSLASAPTGSQFVAGMANDTVKVFDAKTRATLKVLSGNTLPPRAVAWSPKGDRIASGSENAAIRVWDVKGGKQIILRPGSHLRNINGIWFSPDSTKLITTSDDDSSKIWSFDAKTPLVTFLGKGANIYGSRFDPTGKKVYAGTLRQGLVAYAATGNAFKVLGGHPGQGCDDIDVNAAGTIGASAGRDGTVGIWDLKKGQRLSYLRGHSDWVVRVMFDQTGRFLASSSTDMTVRIWDIKTFKQVALIPDMMATGSPLAWVDGGNMLVAVGIDGYPRIYKFIKPPPPAPPKKK